MTVNGMTSPKINVEPTSYRIRLLNGCNGRTLQLQFQVDGTSTNLPMRVYKVDSCYYRYAVSLNENDAFEMPSGSRAELVVDFSTVTTGSVILRNVAVESSDSAYDIMMFSVVEPVSGTAPSLPNEELNKNLAIFPF